MNAQVKILTILEWLVSTTTFLELDHPIDVWLLQLLNIVQLLSHLVLAVLRLQNEIVEDGLGKVRLAVLEGLRLPDGPLIVEAVELRATGRGRCIIVLRRRLLRAAYRRLVQVDLCSFALRPSHAQLLLVHALLGEDRSLVGPLEHWLSELYAAAIF